MLTPNKKVVGATPTTVDGIKFKSKAEAHAYGLAKQLGIRMVYEQRKFILVPKFVYNGKKEQAITHTPDFTDPDPRLRFILEIKGHANDTYPLYRKLLMRHLKDEGFDTKFYLATDSKERVAALLDIKQRFFS
jgi:hypothetical protein